MSNIRLQGSTWHARLVIPKDVRSKFQNKSEFSHSLETGNLKLAKVRGAEIVAGWKREIQIAREGMSIVEWAKDWRKEHRNANDTKLNKDTPSGRDLVELIMIDQLEDAVKKGEIEQDAAKHAYDVATGAKVILKDHRDDYLKQYSTHSIKTQAAYAAAVSHFLNRFKEDKQVTGKSVKLWLTYLAEEKGLAQETISRLLRQAETFWNYLVEHEIVSRESNPFSGFKLAVPKTAMRSIPIQPFKPEEIVAILHSPVAQGDDQLSMIITLAMYTGARIEELAMLKRTDLDMDEKVINIRGTKTDAAERVVPMHPALVSLLTTLPCDADSEYVIPDLNIDKRGERGKALGKRFGRLKTAMGYSGREKCFHSIRKTVATLLEQAEVLEGVAADILGHEKQTMTYGLYSGGSSLKQKRDGINKIKYPEV